MSLRPGAVNFDEKWRDLKQTIDAVVHLRAVKRVRWNDNISDIYALCVALPKSFAEDLYECTRNLLEESATSLCSYLSDISDSRMLLLQYHQYWIHYSKGSQYLNNLFAYFNRVHLQKYRPPDSLDYHVPGINLTPPTPANPNTPVEIRNMALSVWRKNVLNHVVKKVVKALLMEIRRDLDGGDSNLAVVREVANSFIEVCEFEKDAQLELYQDEFEEPFLEDAGDYYRHLSSRLVAELPSSEYIKQAVLLLQQLEQRGKKFLHQSSMIKFTRECESKLVSDHLDYLHSCVSHMVASEQHGDLSNMYCLLKGIPRALDPVVAAFRDRVHQQGLSSLKSLFSSKQVSPDVQVAEFMTAVLATHSKYLKMAQSVFCSHKSFMSALHDGCREFVNYREGGQHSALAPRLLAKYCDQLLRKGARGSGENELEEQLDNAITVFKYLEEKDVFQRFYSKALSRRLVFGNFASMESEESMIQKLKHVCGYEYTARLQRMLVDVTLSSSLITDFMEQLKQHSGSLPITFSTLVLQSGAWQLTQLPCPVTVLPNELITTMKKFEAFYQAKHCGRCLTWLHHLSLGELKLNYLKKPYLVSMTTFQALVLTAYEQTGTHTLRSLQEHTQLVMKELKAIVQSLVDVKLLVKGDGEDGQQEQKKRRGGGGGEVDIRGGCQLQEDTVLALNMQYTNRRTKFKVSSLLQRETQQDIEHTQQMVLEDRKMVIQAAIVRVMKARKTMQHNQLIEETILLTQQRFLPSIPLIKRCVESLIEKLYIERNMESRDTYSYIA